MSQAVKVDIWSDIACPWCYLGKHRFEAAVRRLAEGGNGPEVEVEYCSFQLAPDLPEDFAADHDQYLARKFGWPAEQVQASNRQLQALGAPYGIVYNFAANRVVSTRKGHELTHYAKAHGRQADVKERLLRAHFSEGADLRSVETLADIAQAAGLDRDEAVRVLQSGVYAAAVEQDRATAARLGINGVPFFVIAGRYGLSGAQEPDTFVKALERAATAKTDVG
jgi:predicted DsbA family dithiol-disulfide isomerase